MSPAPRDELLDHDYDGIREYDNPIPQWMNLLFVGTIAFAIFYAIWFHWGGPGKSVAEAYAEEAAQAEAAKAEAQAAHAVTEESLQALMSDGAAVERGKQVYTKFCVPCHGPNAEGKVGPNLTDSYWIHGKGTLMDIHKVVNEGVLAKGMPAWGQQLKPEDIDLVVAYVGTLRGKNVPGKPPQGNKVEP